MTIVAAKNNSDFWQLICIVDILAKTFISVVYVRCTFAFLYGQDGANERQSRAGHAEQGSVRSNNAATKGRHGYGTAVYILYTYLL